MIEAEINKIWNFYDRGFIMDKGTHRYPNPTLVHVYPQEGYKKVGRGVDNSLSE